MSAIKRKRHQPSLPIIRSNDSPSLVQSDSPQNLSQQSDETLLLLVAEHHLTAYELLYRRHAQVLYNLIVHIVSDQVVAIEVLQDTFWQIWTEASRLSSRGSALAWIMQVARSLALERIRRHGALRPRQKVSSESAPSQNSQARNVSMDEVAHVASSDNPTAAIETQKQQAQARQILALIPEEQRICLELAYFAGLSQGEIAEQTNSSRATINSRIRGALERIQELLHVSRETERQQEQS